MRTRPRSPSGRSVSGRVSPSPKARRRARCRARFKIEEMPQGACRLHPRALSVTGYGGRANPRALVTTSSGIRGVGAVENGLSSPHGFRSHQSRGRCPRVRSMTWRSTWRMLGVPGSTAGPSYDERRATPTFATLARGPPDRGYDTPVGAAPRCRAENDLCVAIPPS